MRTYNTKLLAAGLGITVLSCNMLRPKANDADNPAGFSTQELNEDISSYAAMCRHELGFDDVVIPPMNCLDGTEIPTLIDGKPPTADQFQHLAKSELGCDQPSWLEGVGCVNYNFVLTKKLNADVDLALICRSRNFTTVDDLSSRRKIYESKQDLDSFKKLYYFDSLGMIVANKKTGKTCFFDQVDSVFGGFIPYPDRRTAPTSDELPSPKPSATLVTDTAIQDQVINVTPAKTWKKPFQTARIDRCTICHDSGPWKHSPWLPNAVQIPPNDKNIPYTAIGPAFEYWRTTFEPTAIDTVDVKITAADGTVRSEPQVCTSCHRIGREGTCRDAINYAVGKTNSGTLSDTGKKAHVRRWMPPPSQEALAMNEDDFIKDWDSRYKSHFDAMRRCCDDPRQEGCTQTHFGSAK